MSKRDVSASVNMCKPSCFRDGVTCLRNVSVCGFLLFRPVLPANGHSRKRTALLADALQSLDVILSEAYVKRHKRTIVRINRAD